MNKLIIEKKCHACIGVWWQIKNTETKTPIFKSKKKIDCLIYLDKNKNE